VKNAPVLFIMAYVLIVVLGIIGYIANIVKLVGVLGDATVVTTMFIARCVGVIIPFLGAVLGYV